MLEKLSKYTFEIIAGIAIFVAIVYFLPSNNVEIPDIGELALSGVALDFVMDEEQVAIQEKTPVEEIVVEEIVVEQDPTTVDTGTVDTGMIAFEPTQEPIVTETTNANILPIVIGGKDPEPTTTTETITLSQQSCPIPRGGTINQGASVLAYQQRSDDPVTCNIQRRVCNDGILNGSYTQSSCKEMIGYSSEKSEVIAYNIPNSSNPYIQPKNIDNRNTISSNFNATIPSTSQGGGGSVAGSPLRTKKTPITTNTSSSTVRDGTVCSTPWGETVRNGQFVKAYRFDKGFSNLPCEVELRYCVQKNLEGSFAYESCQHYDIAVEDYMVGHYDPNVPSIVQLAEILHQSADIEPSSWEKQTLWDTIKGFVKNIFN